MEGVQAGIAAFKVSVMKSRKKVESESLKSRKKYQKELQLIATDALHAEGMMPGGWSYKQRRNTNKWKGLGCSCAAPFIQGLLCF